jgi:hypothetical protein
MVFSLWLWPTAKSTRQKRQANRRRCRDFDGHGAAAVRREAHRPKEHIQGFTRSHWHWMPPSGECLCRIALAAAMVDDFEENTQNTNKTQLLASN